MAATFGNAPSVRRALLVAGSVVMTAVVAILVAGLFGAAKGQTALSHSIRPAASPLPPVQVDASPRWTFDTGAREWHNLAINAQEVPIQPEGDLPAASGVATVYLDAAEGRLDGDELVVRSGKVRVELGAQSIGTPLGLCSAFLSAFDNGSLIGAAEQRARIAGRLLAPEDGGARGNAANAGSCADASASFELKLQAGEGAASAVIARQDLSAAGQRLSERVPGAGDGTTDWLGEGPVEGDRLDFGADAMPLGLAPERIEARAHSLWLEAEFDELRFPAGDLVDGLTYSRTAPRG